MLFLGTVGTNIVAVAGRAIDGAKNWIRSVARIKALSNRGRTDAPRTPRFMTRCTGTTVRSQTLEKRISLGVGRRSEIESLHRATRIERRQILRDAFGKYSRHAAGKARIGSIEGQPVNDYCPRRNPRRIRLRYGAPKNRKYRK
jgi:hypothetical protein